MRHSALVAHFSKMSTVSIISRTRYALTCVQHTHSQHRLTRTHTRARVHTRTHTHRHAHGRTHRRAHTHTRTHRTLARTHARTHAVSGARARLALAVRRPQCSALRTLAIRSAVRLPDGPRHYLSTQHRRGAPPSTATAASLRTSRGANVTNSEKSCVISCAAQGKLSAECDPNSKRRAWVRVQE